MLEKLATTSFITNFGGCHLLIGPLLYFRFLEKQLLKIENKGNLFCFLMLKKCILLQTYYIQTVIVSCTVFSRATLSKKRYNNLRSRSKNIIAACKTYSNVNH